MDQIAAIHLHVSCNNEEYIIQKSNFFQRTDQFLENEKIQELTNHRYKKKDGIDILNTEYEPIQQLYGITRAVYDEQVVPWRPILRNTILETISSMAGVHDSILKRIMMVNDSSDSLVYKKSLPATFENLLVDITP